MWREGIAGPPEAKADCEARTAADAASTRKVPAARGVTERAMCPKVPTFVEGLETGRASMPG